MKTGTDNTTSGLYESNCCNVEREFATGATFQRCPKCLELCEWEQVDEPKNGNEVSSAHATAA